MGDQTRMIPIIVDAIVLGLLLAILLGGETAQLFKIIFFLLTVGALTWDAQTFVSRAVIWTVLTTAAVVFSVADGRAPLLELLDVVYIIVVMGVVFRFTSQRAEQAELMSELLADRESEIDELATISDLKADFTAMVAHEFGNPLSAIRRLNEMMGMDGVDENVRSQLLTASNNEVEVLTSLVADVSHTVDAERSGFVVNTAPTSLGSIVDSAAMFGRSISADQRFSVELDESLEGRKVVADADRLNQILRNLLSNATKHAGRGTSIALSVARISDSTVRFAVVDDGQGINQRDLEFIFGKYDRVVTDVNRAAAGVGLGLYISRRLVEAHDSSLIVESRTGSGSSFRFDLELAGAVR
jgi:signal transduction histidine kinase